MMYKPKREGCEKREKHKNKEKGRKSRGERYYNEKKENFDDNEKKTKEEEDESRCKRRRRVEEWQKFQRNKTVEGFVAKKTINMDLEDNVNPNTEVEESMVIECGKQTSMRSGGDEEIDPLDAFMNSVIMPEVEKLSSVEVSLKNEDSKDGQSEDSDFGDIESGGVLLGGEDEDALMKKVKNGRVEKLMIVDHSKIQYPNFRKNFYVEVKEIAAMSSEEVGAYRKQLELVIHGKDVPKPVKTWQQTGSMSRVLDTLKKLNYEKPMPIQAQALPMIMSGRDCIGIAKTGSGKTLAFVLPMLRHIRDQPPIVPGDGPIALVMAPTRELVQQIYYEIKKFTKAIGVKCVPAYGGSGIAQQISELKRGAEIVVCTPGRMIDMLCTSGGKVTNLRRVTYLVLDEADRMFDMGFEPQITRIIQNTRPDRQTVLFSATFPHQVEKLARKVLCRPVEIQVGGRSVVNKDITQLVEVRPEREKFLRLLEILGEWYEKGKILTFVRTQEQCDSLFKDLLRYGYPCLSLHGAKDQTDRESAVSDFKNNISSLMIATSIASRGLDVKDLELVINFDVPNHYEEYVHRVGRTGRAGRKGYAITFVSEEDARYAPELVKALELSEQVVPEDLKALADGFMAKVKQGLERAHGSGYGGSGFKFNEEEDELRTAAKKSLAKELGFEEDMSDLEDEDQETEEDSLSIALNDGAAQEVPLEAIMNFQRSLAKIQAEAMPEHYQEKLDINNIPQSARRKLTQKETLSSISDWTGATINVRGQYYPPGKKLQSGDSKLYMFIEGPNKQSAKSAKSELEHILNAAVDQP